MGVALFSFVLGACMENGLHGIKSGKEPAAGPDEVPDADTGADPEDTGRDTDSHVEEPDPLEPIVDTGDAEVPTTGACGALLAPAATYDAPSLAATYSEVHGLGPLTLEQILSAALSHAEPGVCPRIERDGSDFVVLGGCTTADGVTYEGRASRIGDASGGYDLLVDELSVTWGDGVDAFAWFIDAHAVATVVGDASVRFTEVGWHRYTATDAVAEPGARRGTYWRDLLLEGDMTAASYRGYFHVLDGAAAGAPLDLCLSGDFVVVDTCETEARAVWHFDGTNAATLTTDGALGCDNCGSATVDGVAVGEVCVEG